MDKRRSYEDLGDIELDGELAARVEAATAQGEEDVAARRADRQEVRINFRWGAQQLEVVQEAAALYGIPYQSYLKQVVFRQAMDDLRNSQDVHGPDHGDDRSKPGPRRPVTP